MEEYKKKKKKGLFINLCSLQEIGLMEQGHEC